MGRRRRPTFGRRKKRKGKGAGGGGKWLLGVAGLVGLGLFTKGQLTGGVQPIALSTAPLTAEAGQEPAAGESSPKAAPRKGPVPASLARAFKRAAGECDALTDLRRIVVEYPSSPQAQKARAVLAQARSSGLAAARAESTTHQDLQKALAGLTRAYVATLEPSERRSMRPEAEALSQRVFQWKGAPASDLFTVYSVEPGDSLSRIATRQRSDYRLIKAISGLKNDRIRVGQKLRIPRAKVEVLIYKRDFELVVTLGGLFLKAYDIATGKDGKTPEGRFTIGTKLLNPDWYAPDGKVYRFGTKENILGTRWLAFVNTPEHQGFGIHGTAFPNSIGTEASMGCIRLRNHDAEELYDRVPPGSEVRVVR